MRALSMVNVPRRPQIGVMTSTICCTSRSIASLGALLVILTASGAAAQEPRRLTICVDVDVRFTERHPAAVLVSALQREASAIWEPYGVRLEWPGSTTAEGCAPPQASFVVLVNYDHAESATASIDQLGSTHLIPGVIDHAPICVDQETTERVLAMLTPAQLTRTLQRPWVTLADVGRALGRVLAHELGHVLLAVQAHLREGLMRPSFGLQDLVGPRRETFTLSPPEMDRLRDRLFSGVEPTYRAPKAPLLCGQRVLGR